MMNLLSVENRIWLNDFQTHHGRKPRILMIGNIANNAYNDAKILNQADLDCDVICFDYYHIMGCPEWEDADLPYSPSNDFRPDWTRIPMDGYSRPRWFAQGPLVECIEYLISRRTASPDEGRLWHMLLVYAFVSRPRNIPEFLVRKKLAFQAWSMPYRIRAQAWLHLGTPCIYANLRRLKRLASSLARRIWSLRQSQRQEANALNDQTTSFLYQRSQDLTERFQVEFPERPDTLTAEDIAPYTPHLQQWRALLGLYDIVVGFSTDPFHPLLCDKPYFAVEHGTIRQIPFEKDGQGRRTALAYRLAQHCFVTNFDCAGSAELLAPGRYTLLNHPYDEDHGLGISGAEQQRAEIQKRLDCDFLFFHPTRQDWVEGTGYADKRNEVFLRAFANLRQQGFRVGLVACTWGANVSQSQALLTELECAAHVFWVPPLAITPFERMCKVCDVVVDQFKLGAFGGVVFKAMAVGTPIITYLNETLVARQYTVLPPVINCENTSDIESAVRLLIQEPERLRLAGQQARKWIKHHHGKFETINKQIDQFRLHTKIPTSSMLAPAP